MAQLPKHFVQDLQDDVKIRQLGTLVFNTDNLANVIEVELLDGGEAATVSGTVSCAVICSDGSTVPVTNGTISGNTVTVSLTADCGVIPGPIGVGIQIVDETVKTTVFKAIYNVVLFETGTVIDPGSRITLSVSDLITAIDEAVESIPPDYSDLVAQVEYITDKTGLETAVTSDITLTDGKFILSNTGAESSANANYSRSGLVDVTGYDFVRITMPEVTLSSTNMGLAFYGSDESYISGYRVDYGASLASHYTVEYPVPANARYFRTSWFASDGDFSSLYSDFSCTLIKKPQKAGRYVPTWNAGGLAPATGLPLSNSKRIYSDWRHINSGDGIISCADGYTFGVFCKNASGTYLGWLNERTAKFYTSSIIGYTSIDTQWLIAHGADQIAIVLISASDISPSAGSNVTWTCDQGAADATTALEQISAANGRIDALSRDIAVVETNPATSAHGAGEYIIYDGQLYEVISEIAAGETLAANSNIESRTLGDMLTDIKLFNAISIFDSVDSLENGDYVLRAQKTTNGKRLYWEPVE